MLHEKLPHELLVEELLQAQPMGVKLPHRQLPRGQPLLQREELLLQQEQLLRGKLPRELPLAVELLHQKASYMLPRHHHFPRRQQRPWLPPPLLPLLPLMMTATPVQLQPCHPPGYRLEGAARLHCCRQLALE